MRDLLGDARQRLAREIDSNSAQPCEPIAADPWVVSSLLQKSIRRGETEIAKRAALTLFKFRGSTIWRRFMVIAFEDVGVGSTDAVIQTVTAGSDAALRKSCGGDVCVAAHLAHLLAGAPKDRSADYLCGARDHPAIASFAQGMAQAPLPVRRSSMSDNALALPQRAVACLEADDGDRDAVLASFREVGVPEDLVVATGIAAARTREPITLMVPLIWLALNASEEVRVCECSIPPLVTAGEVPLYALDEHTRLGREAIWRLARENDAVRACLERFVPESGRRRAANVAAFFGDASPVAKRLVWDQSETLEAFGIERDLLHAGVAEEGIRPLLDAVRANLDHLNELRAQVLARSQTGRPAMSGRRTAVP
jgi:hypothetical protein